MFNLLLWDMVMRQKKAPQQGIEPWFSDLESDVLTIERLRIRYSSTPIFFIYLNGFHACPWTFLVIFSKNMKQYKYMKMKCLCSVLVLRNVHWNRQIPIVWFVLQVLRPEFCYFLPPVCQLFCHLLFYSAYLLNQLFLGHEQLKLQAIVDWSQAS